jgi:transposase
VSEGIRGAVLAQIGVLTALNTAIKSLYRSTGERMNNHPDGEIFRSFPGAGRINAGQILAEWGDAREVFDHPDQVAALAGITPAPRHRASSAACPSVGPATKRLRVAITTFAANSRFAGPWAADIYDLARAAGKNHPHATHILARAWLRVMWRCWQNGTL